MEDSDDDLEITNVVRRELAKDGQEESGMHIVAVTSALNQTVYLALSNRSRVDS